MKSKDRFLKACQCDPVDRPPVWIMRQAGRYLPEYRQIRESNSFHDVVKNPDLVAEVTLQPLERFDLDAAILFSDILVIPEALGQEYSFPEGGGIEMDFRVTEPADLQRLSADNLVDKLEYVFDGIRRTKEELSEDKPLIGFAGSPWTLATYMIEGGSSKKKLNARRLLYTKPELFDGLMEKLTSALVTYLSEQVRAGVDAIQIFDSWGGVLASNVYGRGSTRWVRKVVQGLKDNVRLEIPIIFFAKGMHHHLDHLTSTGANVISVDWSAKIARIRDKLPDNVAVQGNLDPVVLNTTPDIVERQTQALLRTMKGKNGFIANLGHGITPQAQIENVETFVETIKGAR